MCVYIYEYIYIYPLILLLLAISTMACLVPPKKLRISLNPLLPSSFKYILTPVCKF